MMFFQFFFILKNLSVRQWKMATSSFLHSKPFEIEWTDPTNVCESLANDQIYLWAIEKVNFFLTKN